MGVQTTLRTMSFEEALAAVDAGALFVDLRSVESYLEVHIPGSIELLYEFGPGLASRARDCLPLDHSMVLLDMGHGDLGNAAASLRGKGFTVLGKVEDGVNQWAAVRGAPASTEVLPEGASPAGPVLHVGDPGAVPPDGAMHIPLDRLWAQTGELPESERVVVVAGFGVRAALAVGILEHSGIEEVSLLKT